MKYNFKKYMVFWLSQSISQLGSAMTGFALILWAYKTDHSAMTVSLMAFCNYVPYIVVSLFAGAFVDGHSKKKIMLVSDSVAAICSLIVLMLSCCGILQIWHIYMVNCVIGFMNAFQSPASAVAIARIVPKEKLANVSGMNSFSSNLTSVLTPVLTAFLFAFSELKMIFLIDLLSFAVAFFVLLFVISIPENELMERHRKVVCAGDRKKSVLWEERDRHGKSIYTEGGKKDALEGRRDRHGKSIYTEGGKKDVLEGRRDRHGELIYTESGKKDVLEESEKSSHREYVFVWNRKVWNSFLIAAKRCREKVFVKGGEKRTVCRIERNRHKVLKFAESGEKRTVRRIEKNKYIKPLFAGGREGYTYLAQNKGIFVVVLTMALLNFFSRLTYENILSPMLLARSGNDSLTLGIVNAVMGIGGVVGGIIVSTGKLGKDHVKMIYVSAVISFLFGDLLMGAGRNVLLWSIAGLAASVPIPFINAGQNVILYQKVPDEMQGRVFAVRNAIQSSTVPIGILLGGFLADYVFEPYMQLENPVTAFLHMLVGNGEGSGMAVMFLGTGIFGSILSYLSYKRKEIQEMR